MMLDNVFVSTASFKTRNLRQILELCVNNEITNIELGSNVDYAEDNLEVIHRYKTDFNLKFLIHNYFPRPKHDFVLNLASDESEVACRSIEHCKSAIQLSADLGAPFFSVHAGFLFSATPKDLGQKQTQLRRIPHDIAYSNFVKNVRSLADYSFRCKVKFAVENNVIAKFNLVSGKNALGLLVEAEETLGFHRDVSSSNLFSLIDVGHLKVSSASLGFGCEEYFEKILPYTIGMHLSENDGCADQNKPFDGTVWFQPIVRENSDKIFIIEVNNLEINEVKQCCRALESMLKLVTR